MRIKEGFVLHNILGDYAVVAEGAELSHFNKMIALNASATLLWKSVEGREFSREDLANTLVENFEVGYEQALVDATEIADSWIEDGLIDITI